MAAKRTAPKVPEDEPDADTLDEARRQVHELQVERARGGKVARSLELRALATQHRQAFTDVVETLEGVARETQKGDRIRAGQAFLRTYFKADAHLAGLSAPGKKDDPTPVVSAWYLSQVVRSPILSRRLLEPGRRGANYRAWILDYIEEYGLRPSFAALWRQLGGADQEPRST